MDVRSYIDGRRKDGAEPGTINREVGLLSAAINYARMEWDWDIPNPAQGRRLRESEGRVRWITQEEAGALIRAAESEPQAPHLADFIRLALNTGWRRGRLSRHERLFGRSTVRRHPGYSATRMEIEFRVSSGVGRQHAGERGSGISESTTFAIIPRPGLFRVLRWRAVLTGDPGRVGRFDSA